MSSIAARSRRGRSTRRGAATRDQILNAAREVLAERGYNGTSVAAICERADIAPTSIYWHFGSKAGLLQALFERTTAGLLEGFRSAVAEVRDPVEKLDRVLARMRELVMEKPLGSLTLIAMLSEGGHVSPDLVEAHRRAHRAELRAIEADFRAVLGSHVPDLDVVALLLTACSNYAALSLRVDPDGAEMDRIFALLRRAVLRLLGPYAGPDAPDSKSR